VDILLMVIGGYSIYGHWWIFYLWLLVDIILMDIGDFKWLLVVILLMVIGS